MKGVKINVYGVNVKFYVWDLTPTVSGRNPIHATVFFG
jgi:hypothetical protein